MSKQLSILVILICTAFSTFAGAKKVLLVELHSEKNRLDAARKMNRADLVRKITADAEEVQQRTILDFTDFFTACPVYYFMDSNLDKIKSGQYQGVLMNRDGSTASVPAEVSGGNFIIAYYTTPYVKEMINSGSYRRRFALVVYDNKYQQMDYFYRRAKITLPKEDRKKYYFESKEYEIEYFPLAKDLNKYFMEYK